VGSRAITIKRRRDRTPKVQSRKSDSANLRAAIGRSRKSRKPLCYPSPQLCAPASSIALSSTGSSAVRIFGHTGLQRAQARHRAFAAAVTQMDACPLLWTEGAVISGASPAPILGRHLQGTTLTSFGPSQWDGLFCDRKALPSRALAVAVTRATIGALALGHCEEGWLRRGALPRIGGSRSGTSSRCRRLARARSSTDCDRAQPSCGRPRRRRHPTIPAR